MKPTGPRFVFLNCLLLQGVFILRSSFVSEDDSHNAEMLSILPNKSGQNRHQTFTLEDLVANTGESKGKCEKGLYPIRSIVAPDVNDNHKIPRIVHVTGISPCLTKPFHDNLQKWHFSNYSFYFHDEEAVDRLLQRDWPEFPHLQLIMNCMISGAAKADLWRYLVLWEFGGIYTDLDSAPGKQFWTKDNNTVMSSEDDGFFVVEQIGVLSQYFMALSPKHPLAYFSVLQTLHRLLDVTNVGNQYVPYVTGPGALKNAFIIFMEAQGTGMDGKVKAGFYQGVGNRSVTVVGSRRRSNRYIIRQSILPKDKKAGYEAMGMKHFSKTKNEQQNTSCFIYLYDGEHHDSDGR
jgi:hypothetical protein